VVRSGRGCTEVRLYELLQMRDRRKTADITGIIMTGVLIVHRLGAITGIIMTGVLIVHRLGLGTCYRHYYDWGSNSTQTGGWQAILGIELESLRRIARIVIEQLFG
jgi:hypothetical protein